MKMDKSRHQILTLNCDLRQAKKGLNKDQINPEIFKFLPYV